MDRQRTELLPSTHGTGFSVGDRIGDRYRVLETLGVGGMGVVYRVFDEVLELELALKMLRADIAQDESYLDRFRNELLTARTVTHRHVVRNHDIGIHRGSYFLTMDLVQGQSLQEHLKREGKLSEERSIALLRQISEALAEAHHHGIVHRDLKPANILLDDSGNAYITDFGIARSLGSAHLTRTGELIGSPDYLSPEQARGEKVDSRSDLYSLGIMLIEMLSGKLPFPGGTLLEILTQHMHGNLTSLEELGVELSPALQAIAERCLEKDVSRRYQTAEELLADLDGLPDIPGRTPRPASQNSLARIASFATIALVALVLGALAVHRWMIPAVPIDTQAISEVSSPAAPPSTIVAPPRHSVAVMPFVQDAGPTDLAWASAGVADMLATALAENEDLRVVESYRVVQILEDLGFQPDKIRKEEIVQLAEFLEVDRVVLGKLRSIGDQIHLEMRLLESDHPAASPEIIESLSGRTDQLFDLIATLGSSLRQALTLPEPLNAPAALTSSPAALQAYAEGIEALSRRESLKAAPALEKAVAADPGFTLAWVRLSQSYRDLGRSAEALEASRQAVESAQGAGGRVGHEARAQDALLRGDPERAQEDLEELVASYPNDSQAWIALGEAYGQQGKFPEAVARLERAVQLDPSEPQTWYLLGRFSIMSGDPRRAVDEHLFHALVRQRRLGNEQGQAEVHNALGVGYQHLGLIDEAIESYRSAAEIRERIGDRRGLAVSLNNLAFVQINRGTYDAAEENVRRALAIHTDLQNQAGIGKLTNTYGLLQEERGHYSEALVHFRQSLQVREDLGDQRALAESRINVGFAYYLLGQYDNALLYLGKARELYTQNEDQRGMLLVLPNLGFCELARGNWSQAVSTFLEALKLSRELGAKENTAVIRGNIGQISQYQGRYAAAFTSYREAQTVLAELGNRHNQAAFVLNEAEALLELGELEGAKKLLDQVAAWEEGQRNPEQRSRQLSLRGRWHRDRHETEIARSLFAEALEAARVTESPPLITAVQIESGKAALASGDTDEALTQLEGAFVEAGKIGNAILELRAGEALAEAALRGGKVARADEVLTSSLRIVGKTGTYARAFRLHQLLSVASNRSDQLETAAEQAALARVELSRLRENLAGELLQSFDQLPEVRELDQLLAADANP